jgi:hypothetical protein
MFGSETMSNAIKTCSLNNATVIEPRTEIEYKYLLGMIPGSRNIICLGKLFLTLFFFLEANWDVWVGLLNAGGTPKWISDGANYTNITDQVNYYGPDLCMVLNPGYGMSTKDCNWQHGFVCEYSCKKGTIYISVCLEFFLVITFFSSSQAFKYKLCLASQRPRGDI